MSIFSKYIDKLFSFLSLGMVKNVSSIPQNLIDRYAGTGLTDAENEANEFTHNERIEAQDWSAEQKELEYQRQREFYQDFQSPQAMIRQYQEAGLNPALMYGGATSPASPISSSAPQSSGGTSVSPNAGDFGQLVSLLAGLKFKKMEVDATNKLKGAQQDYYTTMADSIRNENRVFGERFDFWKQMQSATLANINADTFLKYADKALKDQGVNESAAREVLLHYQGLSAKVDSEYAERMNDALLKLRESARDLNIAKMAEADSSTDLNRQKLIEAEESWNDRKETLKSQMREAAAKAGISESEFEAFWSDKRLNELLLTSEVYDNYKGEFKAFGIGGTTLDNWNRFMDTRSPSLYPHWAQP